MTTTNQTIRDYHEWLIMNASAADDALGIFRPYFWNYSLLCRQTLSFDGTEAAAEMEARNAECARAEAEDAMTWV